LIDAYGGGRLLPTTPELRAIGNTVARIHDLYLHPHQKALYNRMDYSERQKSFEAIKHYLSVIQMYMTANYRMMCGDYVTLPDISLYPTMVFYQFILQEYWSWQPYEMFEGRPLLARWWDHVNEDSVVQRIREEIEAGLTNWATSGRLLEMKQAIESGAGYS